MLGEMERFGEFSARSSRRMQHATQQEREVELGNGPRVCMWWTLSLLSLTPLSLNYLFLGIALDTFEVNVLLVLCGML